MQRQVKKQYECFFEMNNQEKKIERTKLIIYFLDRFFNDKKKDNFDHFKSQVKKFMKSYDIFKNLYNKDAYTW